MADAEVAKLEAELQEKQAQAQTAADTLQQTQQELQNKEAELAAAETAAGLDSDAHRQKTAELEAAKNSVQNAQQALAALTAEIKQLETLLTEATEKTAAATQELANKEAQHSELQVQLGTVNAKINDLQQAKSAKETEISALEQEIEKLKAELAAEEQKQPKPQQDYTAEELVDKTNLQTSLTLFRIAGNKIERIAELETKPDDLTDYFLRFTLADGREVNLPVDSIETATGGGYLATALLPQNLAYLNGLSVQVGQVDANSNVHRTFASLVNAIKADPTGTYQLGADLQVDNKLTTAFITEAFTGTLEGNGFSITGLSAALFANLQGTVKNLEIKNSEMVLTAPVAGILAERSSGATIENVIVSGKSKIDGQKIVGGVVGEAQNTNLTSVFFTGNVFTSAGRGGNTMGGLVGKMTGGSIQKSGFHGIVENAQRDQPTNIGGLVGELSGGARISTVYAGGEVKLNRGVGNAGGLVGFATADTRIDNAIAAVKVHRGKQIHGAATDNGVFSNIFYFTGLASGAADNIGAAVETAQQSEKYASLQLKYPIMPGSTAPQAANPGAATPGANTGTATPGANTGTGATNPSTGTVAKDRFAGVKDYRLERAQAYKNYALLLPLASAETIVKVANLLEDNDLLVTQVLRSANPIVNGKVTLDPLTGGEQIDGVFLHYANNQVERRAVRPENAPKQANATQNAPQAGGAQAGNGQAGGTAAGSTQAGMAQPNAVNTASAADDNFAGALPVNGLNTGYGYYRMNGGLPYDPVAFGAVDAKVLDSLTAELSALTYDGLVLSNVTEELKNAPKEKQLGLLYLRAAFEAQKPQLRDDLEKLILAEGSLGSAPGAAKVIKQKILDNKNEFMLGLTYVNKWYNVQIGDANLRDLLFFRLDYFGAKNSPLDMLITLGKSYHHLDPHNIWGTYVQHLAVPTKQAKLDVLIDDLRKQFTTTRTFDEWFKQTTKAHLIEVPSLEAPDHSVLVSDRLRMDDFKAYLLPSLTVSEDTVYLMSHITTLTMGGFERHYNANQFQGEAAKQKVAEVKAKLDEYSLKYRDFYDMWYRISAPHLKERMFQNIYARAGFIYEGGIAPEYGKAAYRSVEEFFGPAGGWFEPMPFNATFTRGNVWMHHQNMLNSVGFSTFTHEMIHNLDDDIFLGGYGLSPLSHPELYPTSFMQNSHHADSDRFGYNQGNDFSGHTGNFLHNKTADRFQTMKDLEQYFYGYFQTLYLLDGAEAEAILAQNMENRARILMQLGIKDEEGISKNFYKGLTADEIAQLDLKSIDDLIEKSLMMRRLLNPDLTPQGPLSYPYVPVLDAIYGTGEFSIGLTGPIAFRRNALEILGAKGYDEGFLLYASNKLLSKGLSWNLPDTEIMPQIFGADGYQTLKEYRKAAYARAKQRATTHMRTIQVHFAGQLRTFNSFQEVADYFKVLMAEDIKNGTHGTSNSSVYRFKAAMFSSFMKTTDEFKTSLYTDGEDKLVPWQRVEKDNMLAVSGVTAPLERPELEYYNPQFTVAADSVKDEEKIAQLRQQIQAQEELQAQAQQNLNQLTQDLAKQQDLTLAAQNQLTAVAGEVLVAQQARAAAEAESTQKRQDLANARGRVAGLETSLTEAQQKATQAQTELDMLRQQVRAQEEAVASARQRQQQAQADADAKQQLATATQAALSQANTVAEGALQKLMEVQEALRNNAQQLTQQQVAKEHHRLEIVRLQTLRSLVLTAQAAQELHVAAQAETAEVTAEAQKAERLAEAAQGKVTDLEAQLVDATAQNEALQGLTVDDLLTGAKTTNSQPVLEKLATLRQAISETTQAVATQQAAAAQLQAANVKLQAAQTEKQQATERAAQAQARLTQLQALLKPLTVEKFSCTAASNLYPEDLPNVYVEIPQTAPEVESLPDYHVSIPGTAPSVEALPDYHFQIPGTAPTVEPLPNLEVPVAPQASATPAKQPALPNTGADVATLGGVAALAALLGIKAVAKRPRKNK
ncbi:MAG: ZmpA/ZmpB/ZmpC family metallo-endopeptidase [Actinomycetaceae bacterium]|nr:ZmpA/ZmpB/ZmpC family metallo-endopeptidase [Actinomycetaceae bacterium]